jgi:hypothetical protein
MPSLLSWCCGASEKEEKEEFCDVSTNGDYVNRVCRNPTLSGSYELIGTEWYVPTDSTYHTHFSYCILYTAVDSLSPFTTNK